MSALVSGGSFVDRGAEEWGQGEIQRFMGFSSLRYCSYS